MTTNHDDGREPPYPSRRHMLRRGIARSMRTAFEILLVLAVFAGIVSAAIAVLTATERESPTLTANGPPIARLGDVPVERQTFDLDQQPERVWSILRSPEGRAVAITRLPSRGGSILAMVDADGDHRYHHVVMYSGICSSRPGRTLVDKMKSYAADAITDPVGHVAMPALPWIRPIIAERCAGRVRGPVVKVSPLRVMDWMMRVVARKQARNLPAPTGTPWEQPRDA